jgi:hypothetical protein
MPVLSPRVSRFELIDRSVQGSPCALRCRRTDARNATDAPDESGRVFSANSMSRRRPASSLDRIDRTIRCGG